MLIGKKAGWACVSHLNVSLSIAIFQNTIYAALHAKKSKKTRFIQKKNFIETNCLTFSEQNRTVDSPLWLLYGIDFFSAAKLLVLRKFKKITLNKTFECFESVNESLNVVNQRNLNFCKNQIAGDTSKWRCGREPYAMFVLVRREQQHTVILLWRCCFDGVALNVCVHIMLFAVVERYIFCMFV